MNRREKMDMGRRKREEEERGTKVRNRTRKEERKER